MRVRQHRSGSSLDDSPVTGEIDPLSEAVEATRLNPSSGDIPAHRHRVVGHALARNLEARHSVAPLERAIARWPGRSSA